MKVFTTGQVAKICKVAPRTVSKWFDSGRLRGYRIPGSQGPSHSPRIFDQVPERTRHALGRPRRRGHGQGADRGSGPGADREPQARTARREVVQGRRSPPAASKPAFRPKASIPIASSWISRSAAWKPCRFARTCAATRFRRNDPDRLAARRRQPDQLRSLHHQRDVQEAVRRRPVGRTVEDVDRRPQRTRYNKPPPADVRSPLRKAREFQTGLRRTSQLRRKATNPSRPTPATVHTILRISRFYERPADLSAGRLFFGSYSWRANGSSHRAKRSALPRRG